MSAARVQTLVNSAFQSSQSNTESHRALGLNLKAAHAEALRSEGGGAEFFNYFVRCLDRILNTSRKDQGAARVVEFVATYAKLICPEEVVDNGDYNNLNEVDSEFETYVEFIESVIERYLPGFASRLAHVRYRCISLVGTLVPLAPLNEDLLETLAQKAIERLRDSDSRVRLQSVILVSRFELTKETSEALANAMQFDPSAEVRLAATYNIAHGSKALTELACERVRDSGAQIRRGLYSKVLKTIDFRTLSIKARENIVRAGLNDRDDSVQRAASLLVANRWVTMSDNNIQLVLQRLDVIGQTEVADMVLKAFFELRRDIVDHLDFGSEFWSELWIEDTLMLRGFQEFCLREKLGELLDDRMPELSTLSTEIEKLWSKYIDPQTYEQAVSDDEIEDLKECLPFMIEQLLQIASRYDFSDEASRQKLTAVINNIIMADDAPSSQTIEHIIDIQRRLNASDSALVSWAFETLEAIPSLATQESPTQESDEVILTSLLRGLSLFRAVLSRVSSRDVAAYLPSLYTSYVLPALQSPVPELRAPALECLGLACLLDQKFAIEHFRHFGEYITEHGSRFFMSSSSSSCSSSPSPSPTPSPSPSSSYSLSHSLDNYNTVFRETDARNDILQELEISIHAMCDMLLVYPEADLPRASITDIWLSLLRSTSSRLQGAAALSLAKVLLAKMVEYPLSVMPQLVSFYFRTSREAENNEHHALTQQQLTLFLRAYCLYEEGKEVVATVFPAAAKYFVDHYTKSRIGLTVGDFVNQFLELTAPTISQSQEGWGDEDPTSDPVTWHHPHSQIGHNLVDLLFYTEDSSSRRSIASCFAKLDLTDAPLIAIQAIQATLESHGDLQGVKTAPVRNALLKFGEQLAELAASKRHELQYKQRHILQDLMQKDTQLTSGTQDSQQVTQEDLPKETERVSSEGVLPEVDDELPKAQTDLSGRDTVADISMPDIEVHQ